ncbi:hypothetical protein DMB65_10575 [Flavobacterium cheongpyeongense]|uniref:Uncharacterized protein n=2 Tax=Flavobacterium cheongpyeongense TaxID=2212651 RepID=A0A2V4BS55_9FLAO|nr:hypothetical protein DMB65_10575 [Flavobacterium cheongpyeongense]
MWVEIKSDIFTLDNYKKIIFLLGIISERPFMSNNTKAKVYVEYDLISNTDLFEKLDSIDKEFLEDSFKQYFYEDNPEIKYMVSNQIRKDIFNLDEAIVLLKEPFWIILENNKNDENFIKSIIFHFDNTEDKYLTDCVKNRWIQFDNAGGCGNVKNLIKGRLNSFENLAAQNNAELKKYYQAFVILDSDKDYENQNIKQDYINLIEYLETIDVNFHILEKRAMENYMPNEVLSEIKNAKSASSDQNDIQCVKWIDVYFNLSESQRNFLKYSGHDSFDDLPNDAQELYRNQLTVNYEFLQNGMKYRDTRQNIESEERRFKNAFPKLFLESSVINKKTLNDRCGSNELQTIFDSINSLL